MILLPVMTNIRPSLSLGKKFPDSASFFSCVLGPSFLGHLPPHSGVLHDETSEKPVSIVFFLLSFPTTRFGVFHLGPITRLLK